MKLFYLSDLHLEFSKNKYYFEKLIPSINSNPLEDILLMAGDIHYLSHFGSNMFSILKTKFKDIFWLNGNHEFYDGKKNINILLKSFINSNNKIHNVNNYKLELNENTIVLFSTLFTEIHDLDYYIVKEMMNDYNVIKFNDKTFYPSDSNTIFNNSFNFIKSEVETNKDKNIIVVSHHVPTYKDTVKPEFKGQILNQCFCTELFDFIHNNENIKYWIFGHNHFNNDVEINKTKLITNQLGYIHHNENNDFDVNKYIEL